MKGVSGLRVVDASIFPELPSGNTNVPCIAAGERAADLILQSNSIYHDKPVKSITTIKQSKL